jgi:hypothetical protein
MSKEHDISTTATKANPMLVNALALFIGLGITGSVINVAAWVTHVVVCIRAAEWGLLIVGTIAFPLGVVHGAGVWLGWW